MGEGQKNVPKLRFKGYEDAWEQRKLGTIAESTYGGGTPKTTIEEYWDGGIPWIQSSDIQENQFFNIQVRKTISEGGLANSAAKLIPKNSIAIVTRVGVGKLGLIPFDFTTSQDFLSLSELNIDSHYAVYLLFKKLQFESKMVQGTSIKGITKEELLSKDLKISQSDLEQKYIGKFFRKIDNIITLHQRKYDALKSMKKTLLSKMFPKNGEDVPEIRFKGFTDAWEQRKLGEFCDMFNGDRSSKYPNASDMLPEGIPFINAGDLQEGRVNLETCNKISKSKYDELSGAKLSEGDIVYCLRGSLGKNAYIDNFSEGTIASSLVAIRPKMINGRFLFHILNSDIEYKQRVLRDEGAAQPNLSAKSLSEFFIPIPEAEEDQSVADFLDNVDNYITLHQRKLDELKNMKKTLLQQMFV